MRPDLIFEKATPNVNGWLTNHFFGACECKNDALVHLGWATLTIHHSFAFLSQKMKKDTYKGVIHKLYGYGKGRE